MAINVKDIGTITTKWQQRSGQAGQAYTQGVQNPKRDWATTTAAAAQTWQDGVNTAITNGRFTKGVNKAGTQKWQANASTTGATRYTQGTSTPQAQANYNAGEQTYLQVIAGLNLPPRYPAGDPRNNDRVSAVTTALHNKKVSG